MTRSKLTVLTGATSGGGWPGLSAYTAGLTAKWTLKQGYALLCLGQAHYDAKRAWAWSKLPQIMTAFSFSDAVLWIDGDAAVTNSERRMEDIFRPEDEIVVTYNEQDRHLECGSFFIRRTDRTLALLDEWWARTDCVGQWFEEQRALDLMWKEDRLEGMMRTVGWREILSGRACGWPTDGTGHPAAWCPGDFICHCGAAAVEARLKAFKEIEECMT